jgi:hypothetical protein
VTFDEVLSRHWRCFMSRTCLVSCAQGAISVGRHLLEVLKDEIVEVHQLARDQEGTMLV